MIGLMNKYKANHGSLESNKVNGKVREIKNKRFERNLSIENRKFPIRVILIFSKESHLTLLQLIENKKLSFICKSL